jgi:hypothetical protein
MWKPDSPQPEKRSFTELLVFIALLIPTFIVLAAAVVSLAHPEPKVAVQTPAQATAACEPCAKPAAEAREPDR